MNAFAALAEPTRASILDVLAVRERTVTEIVALFALTQPSISRHLRILREAGFVSVSPRGRERVYRLEVEPLRRIDSWLERYRKLWARKLDELERHMDEEHPS